MFQLLANYKKLGWDVDETIIDHPLSAKMWQFIKANPFQQEHYIVTFRSGGMENHIFSDLNNRGSDLTEKHFAGVLSCPHELWRDHHLLKQTPQKLVASLDEIPDDPYVVWKGMVCANNGIPVLIDDMTHNVIHGCRKHGVMHIHPDDLV